MLVPPSKATQFLIYMYLKPFKLISNPSLDSSRTILIDWKDFLAEKLCNVGLHRKAIKLSMWKSVRLCMCVSMRA